MITVKKGEKDITYPRLMISSDYGSVVLFTEYGKGICLDTGTDSITKVGEVRDTWSMSFFSDYTGTLELKNEA